MAKRPKNGRTSSLFTQSHHSPGWSIGQRATLAILLEASSRKLGNVHPGARFADMAYDDFLRSAIAIGPVFDRPAQLTVGRLVYQAVSATRNSVQVNTNLGTLLLLAPLAIALPECDPNCFSVQQKFPKALHELRKRTAAVIDRLNAEDSQAIYDSIRLASPGGLGKSTKMDVHHADAPSDLLDAMRVVEKIDQVAKIYCTRFVFLFDEVVPLLKRDIEHFADIHSGIRLFQLRWLSLYGDSLVHRKLGEKENNLLRMKSQRLWDFFLAEKQQLSARFEKRWNALDKWMRQNGHRRNPGTTADLIAAGLFVLLCCQPTDKTN